MCHIYTQTSPRAARQHSRKYCYAFKHHELIVTARTQDTMQCPIHGDIQLSYMAPDTVSCHICHYIENIYRTYSNGMYDPILWKKLAFHGFP